jgi:UDP-N-acetylglucosamine--N-acetylmuramyl-(pentapeptide) pyrophosphoryl-undecaprenol N-acetylglucosamine transferase
LSSGTDRAAAVNLRVLIASGGSGGHLFPAFAVAEEIQRRSPESQVILTTGPREIEREICASAGRTATVLPLIPGSEAKQHPLKFARALWASRRMAARLIAESRPDVVVGTGGFTMTPVVHSALRAKVPVVLLEQNVIPGRATRWYARKAAAVCSSFEVMTPPLSGARVEVTGNPVRSAIATLRGSPSPESRTLLVLGGSQGARALNESLAWIASHHPGTLQPWKVMHQTGGEEPARKLSAVYEQTGVQAEVRAFFGDMAEVYARAGLVIARAGATTLAELACAGIPSVLVPYPHARDLHQHANARVFEKRGAAIVVEQETETAATAERIRVALDTFANQSTRLSMSKQMRELAKPDAAILVVDVIERFAKQV